MDFSNLLQKFRQNSFATGIRFASIAIESELENNHSEETVEVLKSVLTRIQDAKLDP